MQGSLMLDGIRKVLEPTLGSSTQDTEDSEDGSYSFIGLVFRPRDNWVESAN